MVEHRFRQRLVCHQCGAERPRSRAPARLRRRGPPRRARPRRRAARRGGRGALARGAHRDPLLRPRRGAARAQGAHRPDRRRRGGPRDRHPDRLQGAQLPAAHPRRRDRRRPRPAGGRPARRRAHLPAHPPGRRPGRPRRPAGPRARPDPRAEPSGDPGHPQRRRRGLLARRGGARARAGAPPYGRLAGIVVSGTDETRTWGTAQALARATGPLVRAGVALFGPAAAPIARIRGRHRVRLLAKAPRGVALQAALAPGSTRCRCPRRCAWRSTSTRRASSRRRGRR
jgi:primosomal protein N' (replication factor Y) (superfamily II helicase)